MRRFYRTNPKCFIASCFFSIRYTQKEFCRRSFNSVGLHRKRASTFTRTYMAVHTRVDPRPCTYGQNHAEATTTPRKIEKPSSFTRLQFLTSDSDCRNRSATFTADGNAANAHNTVRPRPVSRARLAAARTPFTCREHPSWRLSLGFVGCWVSFC